MKTNYSPASSRSSLRSEYAEDSSSASSNITAIKILRSFLKRLPDGTIDASGVTSPECYQQWLASRRKGCQDPEIAFQRSLTGHLCAVDRRQPFTPEEEAAILKWLRIKQRWPCFKDSKIRFGQFGFRSKGYHERMAEKAEDDSDHLGSPDSSEAEQAGDDHESLTTTYSRSTVSRSRPVVNSEPSKGLASAKRARMVYDSEPEPKQEMLFDSIQQEDYMPFESPNNFPAFDFQYGQGYTANKMQFSLPLPVAPLPLDATGDACNRDFEIDNELLEIVLGMDTSLHAF